MTFKKIANILLVSILLFSGYKITEKMIDYKKSEKLYSEMQTIVTEATSDDGTPLSPLDTYERLKKINPDYKFWIEVENTNINYPVVQTIDNNFYLKKDFNRENSSAGTIFMDALNNFKLDSNIVLYGHNMNNKTMFNNVLKFKKEDFFKQNNKIKIKNTEDEKEYIYEVFSIYHTDNSFDYNTVKFGDVYTFEDFIKDIKSKSKIKKNMTIDKDDQILTLSTCSYEFRGAKTTLHAKLVEVIDLSQDENEDTNSNNENEDNELLISDMIE